MKILETLLPWKRTIYTTIVLIIVLSILNFYGLYTNSFPVLNWENFAFPFFSLIHLLFLYVLWFKIKEYEHTDPQMKITEYLLYAVILLYLFYAFQTLTTLLSSFDFASHVIPNTFWPVGILLFILQISLVALGFMAIHFRKTLVGHYNMDEENQHIDSWE
ncbi:hypothetical protein [Euzebyella saccharophila]|uniref:Uncharacterized protein n=1 Tax=Euzebyella saccharophila TaxID=679664 RepID=A0ABV8JT52_9FLAO|nr:hypothetical protein [Euzebyella saccharophila]